MRNTAWILVGACALHVGAASAAAADDSVLTQRDWARWQGRLSLGSVGPTWRAAGDSASVLTSASLMGDYYFGRTVTSDGLAGGFRATGGLIVAPRGLLGAGRPALASGNGFSIGSSLLGPTTMPFANDASPEFAALPYLGMGYSGLSLRGGWSLSADLGLVAQGRPGSLSLSRGFSIGSSLEDGTRGLRMAPLLQLGASYAF